MAYEPCMMLSQHYSGPSWHLTKGALTEMNKLALNKGGSNRNE